MNQNGDFEFVEVIYTDSDGVNNGRAYTYKTKLDLRLGQKVIAPTYRNSRQTATVTAVNCQNPQFKCKEITEVAPEEDEADA